MVSATFCALSDSSPVTSCIVISIGTATTSVRVLGMSLTTDVLSLPDSPLENKPPIISEIPTDV